MTHLLVTNDFPPKVGGIQSYLWELWRRLPPDEFVVLTTSYDGAETFDRAQPFRVERHAARVLLPTSAVVEWITAVAAREGASLVVLDPALPLGLVGLHLDRPYAVVLHGAEVTVPRLLPFVAAKLGRVIGRASLVVAAGGYPAAEAERVVAATGATMPATVLVPPGVDVDRFRPLSADERDKARAGFGLPLEARLVVSVSRLVPRKGMDVLLAAVSRLAGTHPDLVVAIAGAGRDRPRLERLARRLDAPVRFLGRVPDADLPSLYGCADVFTMLCRNRWGGAEQEGFGIVFLEAAACAVPQVAGDSGGAAEAVVDGESGVVVREPTDVGAVASALARLLDDSGLRARLGEAARVRAESAFTYDRLASTLWDAIRAVAR